MDCDQDEISCFIDPEKSGPYPNPDHIKQLKMAKINTSSRYGDPNDENVLNHYRNGATILHESVRRKENSILGRRQDQSNRETNRTSKPNITQSSISESQSESEQIKINLRFCTMPLWDNPSIPACSYLPFELSYGTLFINDSSESKKNWRDLRNTFLPVLAHKQMFPPIIIPSSGRPDSARLDLSNTMENQRHVLIVVLRPEDEDEYKKNLRRYPLISYFVMRNDEHKTVGTARHICQRLGQDITSNTHYKDKRYVFIMDDNVIHWDGVTLINDPCPSFVDPDEVRSDRSQYSHISLR